MSRHLPNPPSATSLRDSTRWWTIHMSGRTGGIPVTSSRPAAGEKLEVYADVRDAKWSAARARHPPTQCDAHSSRNAERNRSSDQPLGLISNT